MAINRRHFVAGLAASTIIGGPAHAGPKPLAVSACKIAGGYAAVVLDRTGDIAASVALPNRGHGTCVTPDGRLAITIARRPGRFAIAFNPTTGGVLHRFSSPPSRHFCGHGFITPDRRTFAATENDFEQERGVIGLYDTRAGFRRVREIETFGTGPHDVALMADGKTIVVANGGIATHPDFPREKLNIPDMMPSLAYIDLASGRLLEQVFLPPHLHKLSIRHLALDGEDGVWVAGQYEGGQSDTVPLIAVHRRGASLTLFENVPQGFAYLNHYVGSISYSPSSGRIGFTSPRAGRLVEIDAATGRSTADVQIPDVCGLIPMGIEFLATNGGGELWHHQQVWHRHPDLSWDNHMNAIPS